MAQILEVHCRACGTRDDQLSGPLFAGYQPRCEVCGHARLVAWADLGDDVVPPASGPDAVDAWVSDQAGVCSCGGRFSNDAPVRCRNCRSTDISTTVVGTAD